jgi:hypothetical protein
MLLTCNSTGIAGVAGIIQALMLRADKGGSYTVNVALNYYSQWLVNSVGTYPDQVWKNCWASYGNPVFRHYHAMLYTIPSFLDMLGKNEKSPVCQTEFFEDRESGILGKKIRTVKPILRFPQGEVQLGYHVGTRSNGTDQPRWPKDLLTEVVR